MTLSDPELSTRNHPFLKNVGILRVFFIDKNSLFARFAAAVYKISAAKKRRAVPLRHLSLLLSYSNRSSLSATAILSRYILLRQLKERLKLLTL